MCCMLAQLTLIRLYEYSVVGEFVLLMDDGKHDIQIHVKHMILNITSLTIGISLFH